MKVLAKDLRPGDVVRLDGVYWEGFHGQERTVNDVYDGCTKVRSASGYPSFVNDGAASFVLVRRAGELGDQDPTGSDELPAKMTWCTGNCGSKTSNDSGFCRSCWVKANEEAALQPDDPLCTVDDLPDFKHGALAGAPATPTLDECLDALVALHKGAPRNGAMIEGILTRAGRLRAAAPPVKIPVKIPVIPPTLDEWLAWAKEFQHCVNSAALYDLIARAKREK